MPAKNLSRRAVLTKLSNVLQCPCHGSEFSTLTGVPTKGTAAQPLTTVAVKIDGDSIVVA